MLALLFSTFSVTGVAVTPALLTVSLSLAVILFVEGVALQTGHEAALSLSGHHRIHKIYSQKLPPHKLLL